MLHDLQRGLENEKVQMILPVSHLDADMLHLWMQTVFANADFIAIGNGFPIDDSMNPKGQG